MEKIRVIDTQEIVYCEPHLFINKDGKKEIAYYSSKNDRVYTEEEVILLLPTPYEVCGVECGDGWANIVEGILRYVENYHKNHPSSWKLDITQIREENGALHIHTTHETRALTRMLKEAKEMSLKTCEICGSTDNVGQTLSPIKTRCYNCAKKMAKAEPWVQIVWRVNGSKTAYVISPVSDEDMPYTNTES